MFDYMFECRSFKIIDVNSIYDFIDRCRWRKSLFVSNEKR
jgi:hypothetical protein